MHRPSDQDDNWMSPVHGKAPLVQDKEPYGNLDMVTPAEGVRQKEVIVNAEKYFYNSPSIILHWGE